MRPIGLAPSSLGPAGPPVGGRRGWSWLVLTDSHCVAGSQISLVSVSQWNVLQGSDVFSGLDVRVVVSGCRWEISGTKDFNLN